MWSPVLAELGRLLGNDVVIAQDDRSVAKLPNGRGQAKGSQSGVV